VEVISSVSLSLFILRFLSFSTLSCQASPTIFNELVPYSFFFFLSLYHFFPLISAKIWDF
jgi:hypothetical protein